MPQLDYAVPLQSIWGLHACKEGTRIVGTVLYIVCSTKLKHNQYRLFSRPSLSHKGETEGTFFPSSTQSQKKCIRRERIGKKMKVSWQKKGEGPYNLRADKRNRRTETHEKGKVKKSAFLRNCVALQ